MPPREGGESPLKPALRSSLLTRVSTTIGSNGSAEGQPGECYGQVEPSRSGPAGELMCELGECCAPLCDPQQLPVRPFVYIIAWTAAISGLLFGYDVGGSGGTFVMASFRQYFGWPPIDGDEPRWVADEQGWITATATLGCIVGALPSGALSDRAGRRVCILVLSLIFTAGAILQLCALSMSMLYAGRVVAGVGMGGLSTVAPLYQSETAPAHVRGLVVCLQQMSLSFGLLLAGAVNVSLQGWEWGWRVSYGGQSVCSLALFVLMLIMPESPRWLVSQGRVADARAAMRWIRHECEIDAEIAQVSQCVAEEERLCRQSRWRELWSKDEDMWYRTTLGIGVQLMQQACGINAVMYYFPVIASTFLSSYDAILANLGVDLAFVLATFIAVALADRAGRKPLLISGALGMLCFIGVMGALTTLNYKADQRVALAIVVCTCFYAFCFAYSWGPITWLVAAEIFPQRLRGKGLTLTTAASWLTTFAIARAVPLMIQRRHGMGLSGTFLFFSLLCGVMALTVHLALPETMGVSLEDMTLLFAKWLHGRRWARRPSATDPTRQGRGEEENEAVRGTDKV